MLQYKVVFYAYGPCTLRPDLLIRSILGHSFVGWYKDNNLVLSKGFYPNAGYKKVPTGEGAIMDERILIEEKVYNEKVEFEVGEEEFFESQKVEAHYSYNYLYSNCIKYVRSVAKLIGVDVKVGLNKIEDVIPIFFIKYLKKTITVLI